MKINNILLLVFLLTVLCLTENIKSKSFSKLHSKVAKATLSSKISTISIKQADGKIKKCPEPKYIDDKEVLSLINNLTKDKTDQDKITTIEDFISKNEGKPISPANSIKIIQNLNMNTRLVYVLGLLRNYFSITSKDLQTIVKNEKSTGSRAQIIENLYLNLLDKDTVVLEGLLDNLECEEKTKFKVLLQNYKPKDCFFGDLNINKVVFIFDLSGSMDNIFNFDGKNISRLEFLKERFLEAFQNFKDNQYYQIVIFGKKARLLHGESSKLIKATEENVYNTADKVSYLEADGLTNISEGLKLALEINDNIDEIFLFSDGAPTVGVQTVKEFKTFIAEQNKLRKSKNLNSPKINVNLLMLGGDESPKERKLANSFSTTIATLTGGVVKFYSSD